MNQQNDRPGTPATSQLPTHMRWKGNPHGVKPNSKVLNLNSSTIRVHLLHYHTTLRHRYSLRIVPNRVSSSRAAEKSQLSTNQTREVSTLNQSETSLNS